MFAPSIGRVVRSAGSFSAASASSLRRAALNTHTPLRQWHQRRLSSSGKPSVPPENKKKPDERIEQSSTAQQLSGDNQVAETSKNEEPQEVAFSRHHVPWVPNTSHLDESDLNMAVLLAGHRPISIAKGGLHPEFSADEFEKIMRGDYLQIHGVQDVQEALQNYIQLIEAETGSEPVPTEESIFEHAARLRPFEAPPAPVAFNEIAGSSGPSTQLDASRTEIQLPLEQQMERSTTFREHVHQRRRGMLLISVKRQRKLKMKKHKYKKLMKRTRLLRRKLDRL